MPCWLRRLRGVPLWDGTIDLWGANYSDWHLSMSEEGARGPEGRRPDGWPVLEAERQNWAGQN